MVVSLVTTPGEGVHKGGTPTAAKKTKVNGLSLRFTNAVKSTITNLQKYPTAYATRYKNVRIAHTDKFSYAIHFFIDNDLIVITAIIYSGRDPKITFDRV